MKQVRNISYHKIYQTALELFCYDKDKLNGWWMNKNEMLDGLSPFEFVREGKGRELMKIIMMCL